MIGNVVVCNITIHTLQSTSQGLYFSINGRTICRWPECQTGTLMEQWVTKNVIHTFESEWRPTEAEMRLWILMHVHVSLEVMESAELFPCVHNQYKFSQQIWFKSFCSYFQYQNFFENSMVAFFYFFSKVLFVSTQSIGIYCNIILSTPFQITIHFQHTTNFSLESLCFFLGVCNLMSWVVVIPKDGWAPILLLVWHRIFL